MTVCFQLVYALHSHLDHLRGLHLPVICRAQAQEFLVDHLPQGSLYRLGGQDRCAVGVCAVDPHCHSGGTDLGKKTAGKLLGAIYGQE